jgi:hypothetical protein
VSPLKIFKEEKGMRKSFSCCIGIKENPRKKIRRERKLENENYVHLSVLYSKALEKIMRNDIVIK